MGAIYKNNISYSGGNSGVVASINHISPDKNGNVTLSYSDVGALPEDTFIPEKVSQLENDSDYIPSTEIEIIVTKDSTKIITSGAVWTAIDNLAEPMVFKGTLGTGGTITTLPTATTENEGFTYKVITAGTYSSIVCKVGDILVSNGVAWILIPAGDVDSDTWRNIKINGTEQLGSGISTGAVDLVNGTNTTVTFDATGNKIAINLSNLISVSASAPTNGALFWIDTTNGYILKIRESASGSWVAPRAVWG